MTKEVKEAIREMVMDERECGHIFCDFDDYEHDLRESAEQLGKSWTIVEPEDENEDCYLEIEDREEVEEALNYYYELHA